jgi:hypothetical protein
MDHYQLDRDFGKNLGKAIGGLAKRVLIGLSVVGVLAFSAFYTPKLIKDSKQPKPKGIIVTPQVDRNGDKIIDYVYDNNVFMSEKLPDGSIVYRHGRPGNVDDLPAYLLDNSTYVPRRGTNFSNKVK